MGLAGLTNHGPHGLSEILYAFTSAAGNNGSAFAGLNANTHWYNTTLGFTMLSGRFLMMMPMLALAGNLARKKSIPPSPGTFPVNTPLFTVLLTGVILIVGALTFFPASASVPFSNTCCCSTEHSFHNGKEHASWQKNKVSGIPTIIRQAIVDSFTQARSARSW